MRHIHEFLREKFGWYNRCHENTHTSALLWGAFLIVALFYTFSLVNVIDSTLANIDPRSQLTAVGASAALKHVPDTVIERLSAVNNIVLARANEHAHASANVAEATLEELKRALRERQIVIKELALTNPQEVRRFLFDEQSVGTIPEAARDLVEQPATARGTFRVAIAEVPGENEVGYVEYLLEVEPGKQYRLALTDDEAVTLVPETAVTVAGVTIGDDILIPTSYEPITGEEVVLGASTVKKVAIVAINFRNNTAQPLTTDELRRRIFTNPNSVHAYYKEISNGTWTLEGRDRVDGDVYGWLTIDADTGTCDYSNWALKAQQALTATGVSLSGYTNIQYVFPSANDGCGWIGLAYLNGGTSWVAAENANTYVVGHELGHNFGFNHAASYGCPVANSATGCSFSEYGDTHDIMGSAPRHTGNYNKSKYWIPASQYVTATATGSFMLEPTETVSSGTKAIRIKRPFKAGSVTVTDGYYMLEYRTPAGMFDTYATTDPAVTGVTLRLVSGNYPGGGSRTYRVTTVAAGSTFTDQEAGIAITVPSVSPAGAQVDISFPQPVCSHYAPTVRLNPASQWGAAGGSLSYSISVLNNDTLGCTASTFTVTPVLPSGFAQSPTTLSLTVNPGEQQAASFVVSAPTSSAPATYLITENVTGSDGAAQSASVSANYNIAVTDVTAPVVTIVSPVQGSTLTGNKTTISASAVDTTGVGKMEILVDDKLVKTCTTGSSCVYTWNFVKAARGLHAIKVVATDNSPQLNRGEATITVTK